MAFKMSGFSAFTKQADDDKAKQILNEEVQVGDDGKVTFIRGTGTEGDYGIAGIPPNAVINDPKNIVKNNPADDYTFSVKGDTITITGIEPLKEGE